MAIPKYSYQQNPTNELTGFKIEEGEYKDVIYTYGKVSPIEEEEKLRLKFETRFNEMNREFRELQINFERTDKELKQAREKVLIFEQTMKEQANELADVKRDYTE